MTGQNLLNIMEMLNAELQLQAGEPDVAKALIAINVAQDYFETLAAQRPKGFESTTGQISTTATVGITAHPEGLLRIDRMQLMTNATGVPMRTLRGLRRAGGHAEGGVWPYNFLSAETNGAPASWWTNGVNIFWQPVPDATYYVRWYGFKRADDVTAAGTFTYDDGVALPICAFACRLIKIGLDDDASQLQAAAVDTFNPILDTLSAGMREGGGAPFEYTERHYT